MADKSMKELRDEIAAKVFTEQIDNALFHEHLLTPETVRAMAAGSFVAAEAFLAALYDADNKTKS